MRDDAVAESGIDGPVVDLLLVVLGAFHRDNISYCYWKSSRRIREVLAGEADLDLLVAREEQHRARRILLECRLKQFPSVPSRNHPAVESFLGYDESSGLIVHLHLHFRLVLGARLFKNHRLAWEKTLLARAIPHPAFPILMLDPAHEALLLVVRGCIELRRRDPVTLRHWRATKAKFALDHAQLAARLDRATVLARARELVDDNLADRLADAVCSNEAFANRGGLRRRVHAYLAPHRSYNAAEGGLRSAARAVPWLFGGLNKRYLHAPRPWSRKAPGGGIVVAVLGVDGSGKTTVVGTMRAWLGAEIDVLPIYFGTGGGRPSFLLLPFKLMVPLVTRFMRTKPKGSSHGKVSGRPPGALYSALMMLWATVLAVEKRMKLLAARRGADRGLVVVADRYPQNQILDYNDGPLLPRLARVPQWLRGFEARAYALARQLPPDLVIKLDATPETIALREPDMDAEIIRARTAAVMQLGFPESRVVNVDAQQPLADVIRAVKAEIWRML
ncbi:hypothetical protein [Limobrevibacterium gyesilva]|uniref:Thymidylate kinase n=1 Tax=Limobrevibacterium gyesilva TaxID=2991712 RepID=A0AA42CE43_9PROT|nr:hypothetical protein [Limobrevibacterium gyesilva]MCW3474799.1 hypothetical protein [Limobrevibacterium gyesilva]